MLPASEFMLGNGLFFFYFPGLETVDRFPILGAVTGILLTLLMEGTIERFVSNSKSRLSPEVLKEVKSSFYERLQH